MYAGRLRCCWWYCRSTISCSAAANLSCCMWCLRHPSLSLRLIQSRLSHLLSIVCQAVTGMLMYSRYVVVKFMTLLVCTCDLRVALVFSDWGYRLSRGQPRFDSVYMVSPSFLSLSYWFVMLTWNLFMATNGLMHDDVPLRKYSLIMLTRIPTLDEKSHFTPTLSLHVWSAPC